jgi:hypothetical protein
MCIWHLPQTQTPKKVSKVLALFLFCFGVSLICLSGFWAFPNKGSSNENCFFLDAPFHGRKYVQNYGKQAEVRLVSSCLVPLLG